MGEMADYMINGDDCQVCGVPLADEGAGYPRTCTGCGGDVATIHDVPIEELEKRSTKKGEKDE